MHKRAVSVIIINHNGIAFIDACLKSILNSVYPDFEIIFVDNGSTDASLEYVKNIFGSDSRLKLVENKFSVGPAVGRNRGIAASSGKYIVFFDNDTVVDKNCLSEIVKVFEGDSSIGAVQAKLLRINSDKRYDCAGDLINRFGFLVERAQNAYDSGQFDYVSDILSAKSAASAIRKDVFQRIKGFDEDYYMYLEETDLSWRVWLAGFRVVFIPYAVAYHSFGTTKKPVHKYYAQKVIIYNGSRNYITTLIKNLGNWSLVKMLPFHILSWLLLAVMFLFKGEARKFYWIIAGIWWNAINAPFVLKKRVFSQRHLRKVSDIYIFEKIMVYRPLRYYFGKAFAYLYGRPY